MSRKQAVKTVAVILAAVVIFYVLVAMFVFQWRNPLCNGIAVYRHLESVITFQRLPQFQPEEVRSE